MCVSPPAPHTYCCLGLTASCIKLLPRGLPRTSSRHPWMALRVFVLEEGMEGKEMLLASISQVLGNLLLTSLWAVSLPEPLTGITNQGWLGLCPFLWQRETVLTDGAGGKMKGELLRAEAWMWSKQNQVPHTIKLRSVNRTKERAYSLLSRDCSHCFEM